VPKPIDVDELIATLTRLVPLRAVPCGPADADWPAASEAPPASLPGIDLEAALQRLAGNYPVFVGLLKRFENSQGGTVHEVRTLLAGDKPHAAGQLLHRLRGVAANLGATDIARFRGARRRPGAAADGARPGDRHRHGGRPHTAAAAAAGARGRARRQPSQPRARRQCPASVARTGILATN
jgi:HPt (histidine-containing phosphotransfer) domain-containing protein